MGLVEPAVLRGEVGQRAAVPGVEVGDHVVHPVAGEHPLGAHADVALEEALEGAGADSALLLDLRHLEERAVVEHGGDDVEEQQVVVGRGRGQATEHLVEVALALVGRGIGAELAEGVGGGAVEDLARRDGGVAQGRGR